jgi:hypothetical protein
VCQSSNGFELIVYVTLQPLPLYSRPIDICTSTLGQLCRIQYPLNVKGGPGKEA